MFKILLYLITFCLILIHIIYLINGPADLYKTRNKKWLTCYIILSVLIFGTNYLESLYPLNYQISSSQDQCKYSWVERPPKKDIYQVKLCLSGFDTCWEYTAPNYMTLEMNYSLSVYQGKAKLVLVSPFGQVSTLVENKTKNQDNTLNKIQIPLKPGKNKIKLVTSHQSLVFLKLKINEGTIIPLGEDF